jgi:uncharacterized protein (DUF2235 family)
MKNIILSSDGTGNSGGKKYNTNVWNLHTAIDRNDYEKGDSNIQQVTFYDDGVGTDQMKWLKLLSGAFGLGLALNVKELYTFLVYNYEEGDKIYLFGFSRGGFTIRLLADIICNIGILKLDHSQTIDDDKIECAVNAVYRRLRKEHFRFQWFDSSCIRNILRSKIEWLIKKIICVENNLDPYHIKGAALSCHSPYTADIEFMGIWDTVEAYAVPSRYWGKFINKYIYRFQRSTLSLDCRIKKICHVLSIDDERQVFHPVLWDEDNNNTACKHCNNISSIEQVWFSGVHANVGGGYPKQGLAWTSLSWMMEKAKQSGLRFAKEDHEQYIENCDYNDHLYDSRAGFASYYGYEPRNIDHISAAHQCSETLIHISTFQRILYRTRGYAPINLPKKFKIIDAQPFEFKQQYEINKLTQNIQQRLEAHNILEKHAKGIKFRVWQQRILATTLFSLMALLALTQLLITSVSPEDWLIPVYISAFMMVVFWAINWSLRKRIYKSAREFWSASIAEDNWQVIKKYRFSHDQYQLKTDPNVVQYIDIDFNRINLEPDLS